MTAPYACPKNYPRSFPCHKCPAGYLTCRAGTHRNDYLVTFCESCGRQEAMFDPDLSDEMCVHCCEKQALRRPAG